MKYEDLTPDQKERQDLQDQEIMKKDYEREIYKRCKEEDREDREEDKL